MKKVLMLCPTSRSVKNFRMGLISNLISKGCEVTVCAFDSEHEELIRASGAKFVEVSASNRSINPFSIGKLKKQYISLIKKEAPDVLLTFVLKPNVYGALAAKKAGVKEVYSFVEGAGDVFVNNSFKWRLIRKYVCIQYKKAFKSVKKVFFLNSEDRDEFVRRGLLKKEQCEQINGIGVDLSRFEARPIKSYNTFLMIARLIRPKGVFEFCEAAKIVKQRYKDATFNLLGSEGTIKAEDLKEYTDSGIINYLGATNDVRPYLENCSVHVLPTYYREGLVMVNMEASSFGRAVISTDNIGTRETVKDGYSGFLVETKNAEAVAEKIIYFIENPDMVEQMGKNARKYAEEQFDQRVINDKICRIIGI